MRKIGPTAYALELDVTQEEQWRSIAAKTRDVGEVDIVVNNAGYFPNRSIDELDLATWRKTFATNLDSRCSRAQRHHCLTGDEEEVAILQMNRPPGFNAETILGKRPRSR